MTVCVAAICTVKTDKGNDASMIVGASDRMLTAYDVEFQPNVSKSYNLGTPNNTVISLFSGSADSQSAVVRRSHMRIAASQPSTVEEIAEIYADEFAALRRKSAETTFLKPLGMPTTQEFLDRQKHLAPSIAEKLTADLQNARLGLESIIAGVDSTGASIYAINDPGEARLINNVGFAAIGFGQHHAESTFMTNQYVPNWPWENALYLTYLAKKRAELAPGVGQITDLFWIGPYPNGFQFFSPDASRAIDEIFNRHGKAAGECYATAYKEVGDYFKKPEASVAPEKLN